MIELIPEHDYPKLYGDCYSLLWSGTKKGWRIHHYTPKSGVPGTYIHPDGQARRWDNDAEPHHYRSLEAIELAVALHKLRSGAEQ